MAVSVLCPKLTCRSVLRVPDNVRGQRIRCGECGTAFIVPQLEKVDPKPPPEKSSQEKSGRKPR